MDGWMVLLDEMNVGACKRFFFWNGFKMLTLVDECSILIIIKIMWNIGRTGFPNIVDVNFDKRLYGCFNSLLCLPSFANFFNIGEIVLCDCDSN